MKDMGISVKKEDDIVQWYEEVCLKSALADFGEVKGTVIIRPNGFYIWRQVQKTFDDIIENEFQVDNCSFPLLIPERFFAKEAEHAEGFAPELAWIQTATDTDLQEKAIIRPTSETLIVNSFHKWLRNYRQLPMKLNQWCNVLRWEVKQTKLFLRGREFLWQEGHCIYETEEECQKDVEGILDAYVRICKDLLALPVIAGEKTPAERFPGAKRTFTIEGLMPDGKALQMGTSHNLGQGFMKGFDVSYVGRDEKTHTPFYNSWGFATRLLGAVVMTHSDNKGLVLPPKVAKQKVVIIPIKKKNSKLNVDDYVNDLKERIEKYKPYVDDRDGHSVGFKLNEHELHGVPLILLVGDFDIQKNVVTCKVRDVDEKFEVSLDEIEDSIEKIFTDMHKRLYKNAKGFLDSHILTANSVEEMHDIIGKGNLARVHFSCDIEDEKRVEEEHGVGTRCIVDETTEGSCIFTQKPTKYTVLFGRSY
ncbi:MAG: proline--tRNA ligase [Candidatus Woesearchaeota archaeon]